MAENVSPVVPIVLKAADVMTAAPRTCSTFSTVQEALLIFRDADCGAVPILEDGKPIAILTDRDVALALSETPDLAHRPVQEIMTRGITAVALEDDILKVCQVLSDEGVRRVLVVDANGDLQGIIGWSDIAPVLTNRMLGQLVTDLVTDVVEPPA